MWRLNVVTPVVAGGLDPSSVMFDHGYGRKNLLRDRATRGVTVKCRAEVRPVDHTTGWRDVTR